MVAAGVRSGSLRAVLLAAVLPAVRPRAQDSQPVPAKVTLTLGCRVGDVLRFRLVQNSTREMNGVAAGGTEMVQDWDLRVAAVAADGSRRFDVVLAATRGQLQRGGGQGPLVFDSATPPDAAASRPEAAAEIPQRLTALCGHGFGATVSEVGEVLELTGLEALLKATFKGSGVGDQVARGLWSETAIRQNLQELFVPTTRAPVGVGDGWGTETPLPVGAGQYALARLRTLRALDATTARIAVAGRLKVLEARRKPDERAGAGEEAAADALRRTQVEKAESSATATLSRGDGTLQEQAAEMSIDLVMDLGPLGRMKTRQRMTLQVTRR